MIQKKKIDYYDEPETMYESLGYSSGRVHVQKGAKVVNRLTRWLRKLNAITYQHTADWIVVDYSVRHSSEWIDPHG